MAAAAFASVAVAVAACAATGPSSPPPSATASPKPSGPLPIRVGTADPGTWTTTAFVPTLRFVISSDGWLFFFPDEDDEMAVGKGGIELTASRVAEVVDPTSHRATPAPDDLIGWLGSHPGLQAATPRAARVGAMEGHSIQVTNAGTRDVDIFAFDAGNLRVSAGATALITVIPYEGPDLVFCAFAPSATFETDLPEIQSIVDSMEIDAA